MRNIRLDLEYDGRNYCGWQWQPNKPSLEKTVKTAVERMIGHEIIPYSSGRTDAGVHAEQHVVHFFSETGRTAKQFLYGLNSLLPEDIAVYRVLDMPLDWSARHDAKEREYRYTFYNSKLSSPLLRHRTYWIGRKLNIEAMRQAALSLVGKHDFNAFRSFHCEADNPVRKLFNVTLVDEHPLIHLQVIGQAFLRHQVRIIAGTLLHVGLGRIPAESVAGILASRNRDLAGPTLPAHALTLVAVRYPGDDERFQYSRIYADGPVTMR